MKEATGELNMTVITVVAIAAVAAFFYAFVWPSIKNTITRNNQCANVISCDQSTCNGKTCTCSYCSNDDCSKTATVICPDSSNNSTPTTT